MAVLAYDDVMLREPRLLVPGLAPVGRCAVHPDFADARLIYCPAIGNTRNLAPARGAESSSGIIMPITGTVKTIGTSGGLGQAGTATGDYIQSSIATNDDEHLNTMLLVINGKTFAAAPRMFSTRRNSASPTFWAGFHSAITTLSAFQLQYGDNTGTTVTDRRSLITANGAVPTSGIVGIAGQFLTATTGLCYINGAKQALTASGTGGGIAGEKNIEIHDIRDYVSTDWATILLLVLFNKPLAESLVASLSYDPFQIFVPA